MKVRRSDFQVDVDSAGHPVASLPVRIASESGETNSAGVVVDVVTVDEDESGIPVIVVPGKTTLSETGVLVESMPVFGLDSISPIFLDADGNQVLFQADYISNIYWHNGTEYANEAALNTAAGITKSGITRVSTPVLTGAEIVNPAAGASVSTGTGTASQNAGTVTCTGTDSSNSGAWDIPVTTVDGESYVLTVNASGAGFNGVWNGPGHSGLMAPSNGGSGTLRFVIGASDTGVVFGVSTGGGAATRTFSSFSGKKVLPLPGVTSNDQSMVIECVTADAIPTSAQVAFTLGADNNEYQRQRLVWGTDKHLHFVVTWNNLAQADIDLGIIEPSTTFKVAFVAGKNNIAISLNGATVMTDTVADHAGRSSMMIGRSFTGETWLGTVNSVIMANGAQPHDWLEAMAGGRVYYAGNPAARVGYNLLTFDGVMTDETVDEEGTNGDGYQFYRWNFFGNTPTGQVTFNDNGLVLNNRAQLSSAVDLSGSGPWKGVAFGGGAYFEAEIAFDQSIINNANWWPSVWAMAIEHLSMGSLEQWPGQVTDYEHFIELDIFEYLYGANSERKYSATPHDWYGVYNGSAYPGNITVGSTPAQRIPDPAIDWSQFHKVGALWVPATPSTKGYIRFYLDGKQMGWTHSWDQFNQASAPPPLLGTSAFGIMDYQHLALILSTGDSQPFNVKSYKVWQLNADNNLYRDPDDSDWILSNNIWRDDGVWSDTAVWKD